MRTAFRAELDRLTSDLGDMCAGARAIMASANAALVHVDDGAAVQVTTRLQLLDQLHAEVDRRVMSLLALQAPVAHDLRIVVSAIPIAASADRMGGLANNVAKLAGRYRPRPAAPPEGLGHLDAMAAVAVRQAGEVEAAVRAGDAHAARHLASDGDGSMDRLHRELFALVMDPRWKYGPTAAADLILLGRFYGRFADHVADIAGRVVFCATGENIHSMETMSGTN
ncbi:phosphate signaling complex protein PhoU [soil metagenome]